MGFSRSGGLKSRKTTEEHTTAVAEKPHGGNEETNDYYVITCPGTYVPKLVTKFATPKPIMPDEQNHTGRDVSELSSR